MEWESKDERAPIEQMTIPRSDDMLGAMLNWNDNQYKFTLGLGCMANVVFLSSMSRGALPHWMLMTIVLLPVAAFIFVRPGEMPARFVRLAQVSASLWYVATIMMLAIEFAVEGVPAGTMIIAPMSGVGLIPCMRVLWSTAFPPVDPMEAGADNDDPQ